MGVGTGKESLESRTLKISGKRSQISNVTGKRILLELTALAEEDALGGGETGVLELRRQVVAGLAGGAMAPANSRADTIIAVSDETNVDIYNICITMELMEGVWHHQL